MRWIWLAACVFLLLALATSAFSQKQVSDDWIHDQVRRKLAADRDVKGGALEVEVQEGTVTLRGKVRSEKQKSKAERIARKVKGVKRVVNELVVEPF
ncbi:MAG: BON domain-containing protein [Bryobacteraceae bacterium]|jgi:osmotically-inducible protein OsmY|nr:BON domain-containing protein [Bryobacteraceae bacterium]